MKKSGGFIPGIRPGKPTVEYLQTILNRIVFIGACGLVIVQVVPFFFNGVFGANVSFGGTSLIIIVGVVLETIKKIESQMLVRNYSGFLSSKAHQSKRVLGYEMRQFSSLYAVPFWDGIRRVKVLYGGILL